MHGKLTLILAAAALCAPAAALADTTLSTDPHGHQLSALDGTRVWISGERGAQTLMEQRGSAPAAPVPGSATAEAYHGVDLGHDSRGRLVASYMRCLVLVRRCRPIRDDLHGHRTTLRGLAPRGCTVSTAPAIWGARVAYGVSCGRGPNSGALYVRTGAAPPRRLPLPHERVAPDVRQITWADLRGSRVGAVVGRFFAYAFNESVTGRVATSYPAATTTGDTTDEVAGLQLDSHGGLWTLTDSDDPSGDSARIDHTIGSCRDYELLASTPSEPTVFPAAGLGVDGDQLYLTTPQGIVQHTFTPGTVPACGTPGS